MQMCFNQVNGKCAKKHDGDTYPNMASRLVVPVMYLIGAAGGWLWCGIWFGIYLS